MSQNTPKTELLYNNSKPIDHLNVSEAISLMIQEQKNASLEVKKASKPIEIAINSIHKHLLSNPNGRLIYDLNNNLTNNDTSADGHIILYSIIID